MFARLKSVLNALHVPTIEEQERHYLEGSVSLCDLERRERDIAAGMFRKAPRYY